MKRNKILALVLSVILTTTLLAGCSKQFLYQYAVVDINDHYVYIDATGHDWFGNTEDAKTFTIGNMSVACTNVVIYSSKPDSKCYEYTVDEFVEHTCGPDADWRCPHSGHEPIN